MILNEIVPQSMQKACYNEQWLNHCSLLMMIARLFAMIAKIDMAKDA